MKDFLIEKEKIKNFKVDIPTMKRALKNHSKKKLIEMLVATSEENIKFRRLYGTI